MTDTAAAADDAAKPEKEHSTSAAELAAESLGVDLLEALVNEFGQATAWKGMTELQRQTVIDRLRVRIQKLVAEALHILFVGEYPACRAVLESITVKEGVKVALKIARTEQHLVELAEHVGTPVVLLMSDPQQFFDRMEQVRAAKDQGDLFDADGNLKVASDSPADGGEASGTASDASDSVAGAPPLWRQAQQALDRIGVLIDDETASAWTDDQCTEATYWVQVIESIPKEAPPAPKHVKIPTGWKRPRKKR